MGHTRLLDFFLYLCSLVFSIMKVKIIYIITLLLMLLMVNPVSAQHHKNKRKQSQESYAGCPLIDSIIDFSKTKLGCAYRSGGTGPNSFDCSGFMYYIFGHFNIQLGRSSRDQILMGQKVDRNDIRPGDLVFWYRGKGYVGHAGMVVEVDSNHNFKFIHSATHGKGVRYDYSTSNWYTSTYAGARRIIDCDGQGHAYMLKADGKSSTLLTNTTPKEEPVDASTASDTTRQTVAQKPVPAEPVQKTIYHRVKSGETLSVIARKYHVTVSQLKQWNHLRSDMIREGAKLKIIKKETRPVAQTQPAPTTPTTTTPVAPTTATQEKAIEPPEKSETNIAPQTVQKEVYHTIARGETLSAIARKYHVTVDQIKQWNHLKSDMIHEGDKLKIFKTETAATAPSVAPQSTEVKSEPTKPVAPQQKVIYHKIKQGETLSTIARKYHVTVNQIKQWNHLKSDMIREDAKLKIIK